MGKHKDAATPWRQNLASTLPQVPEEVLAEFGQYGELERAKVDWGEGRQVEGGAVGGLGLEWGMGTNI